MRLLEMTEPLHTMVLGLPEFVMLDDYEDQLGRLLIIAVTNRCQVVDLLLQEYAPLDEALTYNAERYCRTRLPFLLETRNPASYLSLLPRDIGRYLIQPYLTGGIITNTERELRSRHLRSSRIMGRHDLGSLLIDAGTGEHEQVSQEDEHNQMRLLLLDFMR